MVVLIYHHNESVDSRKIGFPQGGIEQWRCKHGSGVTDHYTTIVDDTETSDEI